MIVKLLEGKLISNHEGQFIPLYFQIPEQTASLGPLLLLQPQTAVTNPRPTRHQAYDRARLFHYFGNIKQAQTESEIFSQKNPNHYDLKHLEEIISKKSSLQENVEIRTIETTPGYCSHIVFGKKNLIPKLREFDPSMFRDTSPTEQYRLSYEETAHVDDQLMQVLKFQQQGNDLIGEIRNQLFYQFLSKKAELIENSVKQQQKDSRLTQTSRLRTSYINWIEKITEGKKTEIQLKKAIAKKCFELDLPGLLDLPVQPIIDAVTELSRMKNQILESAKRYDIRIESTWHENITLWKHTQNGIELRKYNFTDSED